MELPHGISLFSDSCGRKKGVEIELPKCVLCHLAKSNGLPLAQGTITDGLRRIAELFEPMMPALHKRQMGEKLFHGDATRWEVFEKVEGKTGHRWYL